MAPEPHDVASPPDEAQLLDELRRGRDSAYETLVRLYGGRMLAVARRLLAHEEDARDAVQEAFLAAFRGIDQFAGHARLSTWLHRIVVNTALMRLRSRRREAARQIEAWLPTFHEDWHQRQSVSRWPAVDAAESDEIRQLVRQCIDQLPDAYRTVLLLRDIEELDTEETARVLAISPGAVKTRLHRARQALRTLLDPHLGGAV
jgi:RNA polymerase sigma-70 factor (ECF subfamily)